ncbi:RNA polymerase sigma factor [Acidobacteriota bacterium]
MPEEREDKSHHNQDELPYRIEEVYTDNFDSIFSFMMVRFRDRDKSYDLTQEVFLRFLKTRPKTIEVSVPAFLYGIARRVAADYISGKKLFITLGDEGVLPDILTTVQPNVIGELSLQKCLDELQEIDQIIMKRHYLNDEPYDKVAMDLSMKPDRVRQRAHRAAEPLRRCLEKE